MSTKRWFLSLAFTLAGALLYGRMPYMCGLCIGLGLGVVNGMKAPWDRSVYQWR